MAFVSSSNNNTNSSNKAVHAAYRVTTASTQVNTAYSTNIDNLKEMDLRWQMAMLTMRARRFLIIQERSLLLMVMRLLVLISPKWSAITAIGGDILLGSAELQGIKTTRTRKAQEGIDQVEEGPNYALMAYSSSSSDSEVSNNSTCSKSCLETVKLLKSQYDQLLKDFKKSKLMVLGYKTGLESVEERLEFYKKNESIYEEKIKGLKWDIQVGEITIGELRKKLEIVQKEKDSIQFNVNKFENASKSLNKLIESQIVDNYKKGLGYNAVPPPYTGNFMPLKPDLSFIGLDEFVNKPVIEDMLLLERIPKEGNHKKSSHDDESKPSSDDGKNVDQDSRKDSECKDQEKNDNVNNTNNVNTVSSTINVVDTNEVNVVGGKTSIKLPFDLNMSALEDYSIFEFSRDDEDDDVVANMNNLDTTI
ncbi:hypothetical protein Tco_0447836 [Tanacetum coccineum]